MTTFASQKSYPMDRTLSRLRRLERKRRIAANQRPKNCVEAANKKGLADAEKFAKENPAAIVGYPRFHATKGWRSERL